MTVPSNWSETLLQYIRKWKAVTDRAEQEEYLGDRPFDNFVLKSGTSSQLAMPANLQKWTGSRAGLSLHAAHLTVSSATEVPRGTEKARRTAAPRRPPPETRRARNKRS